MVWVLLMKPDARAFTTNLVVVPIILLENLVDHARLRLGQHRAPAGFIIETTPPALAHVSLIADHFVMVGDALGTI